MGQTATIDVVMRTVRRTVVACLGAATCALLAGIASGHPGVGLALAVGLGLGSFNGLLVRRSAGIAVAFGAVSLARLTLLTIVALAISLVLGLGRAWLVLLGLALAQLLLVAMAARQVLAR
jgi:hypothetical protein